MSGRDRSLSAGVALLGAAALALGVAALTNRGDMTSATLVLVGFGAFVGGVLVLTQDPGAPVAPWVAGLAVAGGVVDLARLAADLGLQGNARMVPRDGSVVQVVPVGDAEVSLPDDDYSFLDEGHGGGLQLVPTGLPLYERLVREDGLALPGTPTGLCTAIGEVGGETLGIADSVEAVVEGDGLVVVMEGFRLYDSCRAVRGASPKVCTMIACPVCSLYGVMAAAGLERTVVFEHAETGDRDRSVRLSLRLLS